MPHDIRLERTASYSKLSSRHLYYSQCIQKLLFPPRPNAAEFCVLQYWTLTNNIVPRPVILMEGFLCHLPKSESVRLFLKKYVHSVLFKSRREKGDRGGQIKQELVEHNDDFFS